MQIAIQEAKLAKEQGEVPVGAVIINPAREIISRGRNMTRSLKDPTAHAEIIAIRKACTYLDSERLTGCSIYVTLEPCSLCASAISFAHLKSLFYGASDLKSGAVASGQKIFSCRQTHFKTEIFNGFHEEEISSLMKDFFLSLRKSK
tara:strand:+ start:1669 stop:2109 length:441 start_codon:yes stop_codon:yes gene_type:complete